ncbi:hypothetical protein BRADI_1g06902v3 [Brachypodium distachyon]|uniref:Reverse transcriptase zinc-binding domain-containing protein n=1 Tax=Brachypodium distachyon TaxID=15368 RepID=A0A0Q3GPK1_BRADI|nr:hypothetical protein BRADI_1g06902v3 [Brachypodium distachyon]
MLKIKHVLMCCEPEILEHLFFSCDITKQLWHEMAALLGSNQVNCYEDVARLWLSNTNHAVFNMISCAFLWTMWKFRNDMHFGRVNWSGLQIIWHRLVCLLKRWSVLCPRKRLTQMDNCVTLLENKVQEAPRILLC